MKTDEQIKADVEAELQWDSRLQESNILVEVTNGHLVLKGSVTAYPKKINAEKAVRRVAGVKSVENELEVLIPDGHKRTDKEIEEVVRNIIKWNSSIDESKIKVEVKDGWVTLDGEVEWEYQRSKARILAEDSMGVTGVTNLIKIGSPGPHPSGVEDKIRNALNRNQYLDSSKIEIQVHNGKVILTGEVRSLAEKGAAETAAWCAKGITQVVNRLTVNFPEAVAL